MERFFLYNIKFRATFLLAFLVVQLVNAQSGNIMRPTSAAGNICANSGKDGDNAIFTIEATYTIGYYLSSNTFSLLLSDVNGNFDDDNPNPLTDPLPTDNSGVLQFEVDFSEHIENLRGSDNYQLRVVTTNPEDLSQDLTIPIYYADSNFLLSAQPPNLCDPPVTIFAIDPTNFLEENPENGYAWYRAELGVTPVEFSNSTLIDGETSDQITVSEVGQYFFVIDIGECAQGPVGNVAMSNIATVEETGGVDGLSILGASSVEECSDVPIILEGSVNNPNLSYRWYKGGEALEDSNNANFMISGSDTAVLTISGIDAEGEYRLAASTGNIGGCTNQTDPVQVILKNPKITITTGSPVLLLPPGEPQTLTAEIRGENPEITWFRTPPNSNTPQEVPNSDSVTIEVTEPGTYTASLTAESECDQDNTVTSKEEVLVFAPENLSITINYSDPNYDDCELDQVVLEVTEVTATIDGAFVSLDETALQSLQVDWQRDGVSTGETAQSILIDSASDNGSYTAVINGETSNPLSVILALESLQITKTPESLPLGQTIDLSLGIEDTTGYTFQWFRNTTEEISNSNSATITVDQAGIYTVRVFFEGCEAVTVNPPANVTTGSLVIPSVITPNGDGINDDWVLPSNFTQLQNVEVNVYASNGELDYSTVNYDGEWPEESRSKAVGTVYYYIINVDNNPVEQGSITIIR